MPLRNFAHRRSWPKRLGDNSRPHSIRPLSIAPPPAANCEKLQWSADGETPALTSTRARSHGAQHTARWEEDTAYARPLVKPPGTMMPSTCSGATRGGNSAPRGRDELPVGSMPINKSLAASYRRARRAEIQSTRYALICRAKPKSYRPMKDALSFAAHQLPRGFRTRNWPTLERFFIASVCRPPTRLRRMANMSSSIFWRILAQLRLLTPPTRIL